MRFAEGFAEFASFAASEGAVPSHLASNLRSLLTFLSAHPGLLQSRKVEVSAAVFLGNTIAALDGRARWQVLDEPEVRLPSASIRVLSAIELLVRHPERHDGYLNQVQEWIDAEDEDPLDLLHTPPTRALVRPAIPFRRPAFPATIYLDDAGEVIDYGDRYPGSPPEDASPDSATPNGSARS